MYPLQRTRLPFVPIKGTNMLNFETSKNAWGQTYSAY